jgi:hypothetical protein
MKRQILWITGGGLSINYTTFFRKKTNYFGKVDFFPPEAALSKPMLESAVKCPLF